MAAMRHSANGKVWTAWPASATRGAALLVLAACAVQPAAAQMSPSRQLAPQSGGSDSDDEGMRPGANVPGLSGFSGRGLALAASLNTRYETNLSRQGLPDDGVRIQPRASAEYGLGSSRLGVFVEGSYGRDIVLGNNFFRGGNRSSLAGGVDFALSRCSGEVGGSFRESLNLRSEASVFGGFLQQSSTAGVAASCRFGRALTINAGINRTNSQNSRGGSRALNIERMTVLAGMSFNASALGQFSLSGSISDVMLEGRQVFTPDGLVDDGFQQRSLRVGLSRALGRRIFLNLGGSYIQTKPGTESSLIVVDGIPQFVDRSSFSGIGYDAGVDLVLTPRFNMQITATRSVNANPFVGANLVISEGVVVSADTKLGRFNVSAGGRFRQSTFQGGFVSQFDPVRRRSDRLQNYFMRVGGRIGQRIGVGLELNHTSRVSDPATLSFSSTGGGLNLSVAFGRGSR